MSLFRYAHFDFTCVYVNFILCKFYFKYKTLRKSQFYLLSICIRQALKDPVPGTPTIVYPPEVLRAIQQAKEANNNVVVAQHKVAEAKHAALFQQKIALAKEAAAREAAARYE